MRTLIYQWIKTNSMMLVNAGSLVGTMVVTGVLGFAFWWVAARQFPPQAVGLASTAISAMPLLGDPFQMSIAEFSFSRFLAS
jgi:hypothetical protein